MIFFRKLTRLRNSNAFIFLAALTIGFCFGFFVAQRFASSVDFGIFPFSGRQGQTDLKVLPEVYKEYIDVVVHSGRYNASISINGEVVISQILKTDAGRGMNILILSPSTGKILARELYDTYTYGASKGLVEFLSNVHDGRILIVATKDDVRHSLSVNATDALVALGSKLISSLAYRGVWAFIGQTGPIEYRTFLPTEKSSNPGILGGFPDDLEISARIPLKPYLHEDSASCNWGNNSWAKKRSQFCKAYDGYGSLCRCVNSVKLPIVAPPLPNSNLQDVPLAIMTGTRAKYLYKCLTFVLSTMGANPNMITVMADGLTPEVRDVADLMGVKYFHHESRGEGAGRICYHYQQSLTALFDELYPRAEYVILIEEDLQIAPDFFSYFSQTISLFKQDKSLYCISAWNDQCYKHTCQNKTMLYRVQTMPGLGWLLSRSLYKKELEPIWPAPEKKYDWDMWMRMPQIRKKRECIVPDVSRTFHFGASGLNVNYYFQETYFNARMINDDASVRLVGIDRMIAPLYEHDLHATIPEAIVLDHSKDPCASDFFPTAEPGSPKLYVVYFMQSPEVEKYANWLVFAKCLKIWDLDVRGFHNSMFRLWFRGNHIFFIGSNSPYAVHKPPDVKPIDTAPRIKKLPEIPQKKKAPK